jgi:phosphopantothenoylcysteine synthetase/decarboxylase
MAHARECVRLAGLTDDQEVRDQLIALARDWIVAARKEEEEEDDDSKVLVFPSHARNRAEAAERIKNSEYHLNAIRALLDDIANDPVSRTEMKAWLKE